MYRIQKSYYTGTDETKVRLTLQEPYRDFVVSFSGDLTNVEDDILEQRAIGKLAREFSPSKAIEDLAKIQEEQEQSIKSILKTITLAKDLSKDQKEEILSQYEEYKVGKEYKEKDKFTFDGKVYEVKQEHRSQVTWIPSSTPNLYTEFLNVKITNEAGGVVDVVSEFRQPTGAHDAYNKGDKVSFEGAIYESTIDSNTFSPTQYPEGWKKIE